MRVHEKRGFVAVLLAAIVGVVSSASASGQQQIEIRIANPPIGTAAKVDPALRAAVAIDAEFVGTTPSGSIVLRLPPRVPVDARLRRRLAAVPGVLAVRRFVGGDVTPVAHALVHRRDPQGGARSRRRFERRSLREPGWQRILQTAASRDDVIFIEPDYRYGLGRSRAAPTPGTTDEQWALATIHAPQGADATSSVLIAVLDTGVDLAHPDLVDNLWRAADGSHGTSVVGGSIQDTNGHGTAVTGVIAARGGNGTGVDGVAWVAEVMTVKVFPDGEDVASTSDLVNGIFFAIDRGAKIINASWGSTVYSEALHYAIQEAATAGVLFVTIAGNGDMNNVGQDLDAAWGSDGGYWFFPAMIPEDNIVTVMATDDLDVRAPFSNFGELSVDLAAPGVDILTTAINPETGAATYDLWSGTSFAAPLVAGAAALAWTDLGGAGTAGFAEVKDVLFDNARRLPDLSDDCLTQAVLDLGFLTPNPIIASRAVDPGEESDEAEVLTDETDLPPEENEGPAEAGARRETGDTGVEWTGELEHPVHAIGGETTGTVLRSDGRTIELDLRGVRPRPDPDALSGRRVRVSGFLIVVRGLERPTRSIVRVRSIAPVDRR